MKPLDPWTMPLCATSLIEASAGTGKTYTLTTLYLRLLAEAGMHPSQILVVTYTQAATAELRERVRERLREAIDAADHAEELGVDSLEGVEPELLTLALSCRKAAAVRGRVDPLRQALQAFDEAAIFTIHGFCQRTLQENAFESGLAFDAELVEQSGAIERTLAHDLFARLLAEEEPSFVAWLLEGGGKRWQFDPETLERQLLRELGADEEMPIVPDRPEFAAATDGATNSQEALAARALIDWAALWRERRTTIERVLLDDNDLKGNLYRAETIAGKWLPEFDRLASRIEDRKGGALLVALELPSVFAKLTTEAIEKGTKKGGEPPIDPCFRAFDAVVQAIEALDEHREARALWLRHRFVECAREEAARRRNERHLLFFDDLLSELRRALRADGGEDLTARLRDRYRFALIDEFQDTDPVQYDVFRHVFHEGPTQDRGLVLIGDPKQAIYSFRGADVYTYLAARSDAGEASYGLAVNWRSDPALIASVNAIFGARDRAFQIDEIGFDPVEARPGFEASFVPGSRSGAGLRVLWAERNFVAEATGEALKPNKPMPIRYGRTLLMRSVARDIADLLESDATLKGERIAPSDIAILCRRKSELQQARRALEALGIPCVDRGDADVFESREAWEFACVLRAMIRSTDPATLRGALSSGAHGLDAQAIAALEDATPELAEISERFAEYGRIWTQLGFSRAVETWRRREGVTERLLAYDDGERRLTNWLHLAELLQRLASERSPSRGGLVAALERAISSSEARLVFGSEASLLRLERDDHAVTLMTLHRSKGLEYPIVYLPSLWEDPSPKGASASTAGEGTKRNPPVRYHDAERAKRTLDLAGHAEYGPHLAQNEEENFSEQLRLLYVGLTRARHQCIVAWGALGDACPKTPLAWLLHGEEGEALSRSDSAKTRAKWSDDEWRGAWEAIAARAGEGAVEIVAASFDPRGLWKPEKTPPFELTWNPPTRALSLSVRTTSFSGLAKEGHRRGTQESGPAILGRDLDADVAESALAQGVLEEEVEPDLVMEMDAFPRGADAGTLLHEVLEEVDFRTFAESAASEAVDSVREAALGLLARNNLDDSHVDQVLHVVSSVARTPLRSEPTPFCLADVAPGQLRPEIEFTLATPESEVGRRFDPAALAELLRSAPEGSPLARYADRAGRMGFRALSGYLRGFIDAVFFDGERYYLVDYKSNHLGAAQADYMPPALVEPMIHHDYILQYLLYAVALDRHLASRIENYDYDVHMGGAYYLFLRGFAEGHAPGCGVFFDRPPREIVHGAAALMGLDVGASRG